jgi:hypothetical protein
MLLETKMSNKQPPLPVTVRFPEVGKKEFYTGLTRNALLRMWRNGLLQTTFINPGTPGRGYRVIFLRPLIQYLEEQREFMPGESLELPENPPSNYSPRKKRK